MYTVSNLYTISYSMMPKNFLLIKDLDEKMEKAVPNGGSTGQVLTKKSNKDKDAIWQNPGVSEEQINTSVNKYLKKNPVQPTSIDETLTKEGEAADAKVTGEKIEKKVNKSGWNAEKFIGTDDNGEIVEIDPSSVDIEKLVFKSEDGNKYELFVDENGTLSVERHYEMPKDGLILDLYVKGGSLYDSVSRAEFTQGEVLTEDTFGVSSYQRISEDSYDEFSFIAFYNYVEAKTNSPLLLSDNANFNKSIRIQYGSRYNFNGLVTSSLSWNSAGAAVSTSAKIGNIAANNGYELLAVSFRKDGTVAIYRDPDFYYVNQKSGALPFTKPTLGCWMKNVPAYKRIAFYNRALTDEELYSVSRNLITEAFPPVPSYKFLDGMTGLQPPTAFAKQDGIAPFYVDVDMSSGDHSGNFYGVEKSWTNIDYAPVSVSEDTSYAEELLWTHIKEEIEVDDIFACEAYPYPYDVYTSQYNVEYESSNPDIIKCIKGVLFAITEGKATITAKLSNSSLTCSKEITVVPKKTIVENFLYLSQNYSNGLNSLDSQNPRAVAAAIRGAVSAAVESGYNGIVFPKGDYNVRFDDCDESNVFIQVPSDFIIDFNDSVWYIQEREDIATRAVTVFQFGKRKDKDPEAEGVYGDWELCRNSVVKNLTIYGERCFKTYEKSEVKGDQFARFTAAAKDCKLSNVYIKGMTGWITDAQCSDYAYWTGKGDGDNRRGRTLYTDYVAGKLNETGTEVVEDPTGTWYCTPEYLKTGYVYGKDSIKSNEMDKYLFGFMGIVTYSNPGRWYDIYFFDGDKQLISYNPKQFGLEPYQYPENAVYFKVNVPLGVAPTKNSGEDSCLIRLYPYMEAEHIVYENCRFINPQYTSFSMTGGRDCVIRDCYCEQGLYVDWGWAVDWEDGWQTMRHNIHYRMIAKGNVVFPGSHHNCVLSSFITGNLSVSNDTEDVICINNIIGGSGNFTAKTNNIVMYNRHKGNLNYTVAHDVVGTNREASNEQITETEYNNFVE